jgi:hypothetical protein
VWLSKTGDELRVKPTSCGAWFVSGEKSRHAKMWHALKKAGVKGHEKGRMNAFGVRRARDWISAMLPRPWVRHPIGAAQHRGEAAMKRRAAEAGAIPIAAKSPIAPRVKLALAIEGRRSRRRTVDQIFGCPVRAPRNEVGIEHRAATQQRTCATVLVPRGARKIRLDERIAIRFRLASAELNRVCRNWIGRMAAIREAWGETPCLPSRVYQMAVRHHRYSRIAGRRSTALCRNVAGLSKIARGRIDRSGAEWSAGQLSVGRHRAADWSAVDRFRMRRAAPPAASCGRPANFSARTRPT